MRKWIHAVFHVSKTASLRLLKHFLSIVRDFLSLCFNFDDFGALAVRYTCA